MLQRNQVAWITIAEFDFGQVASTGSASTWEKRLSMGPFPKSTFSVFVATGDEAIQNFRSVLDRHALSGRSRRRIRPVVGRRKDLPLKNPCRNDYVGRVNRAPLLSGSTMTAGLMEIDRSISALT